MAFRSEFAKYLEQENAHLPNYPELESRLQKFALNQPKLSNALKRYTSENGKEITHWTKKNIDKRIELIEMKRGKHVDHIKIAKSSIYDKASEALHGTIYGSLFHIGIFRPKEKLSTKEMLIKEARDNMVVLLQCCLVLLIDLLQQLKPYCLDSSIIERAKILNDEFSQKGAELFK